MDLALFGFSKIKNILLDQKQKGDCFYSFKHELVGYDILLSNSFDKVMVTFLAPQLIQKMLAADKADSLHRVNSVPLVRYLGGQGLIFIDGQEWKNSKKVLSKIFNYDFIAKQAPSIVTKSNKVFAEY